VCVCLLLDTFYICPEMSVVFVTSVFLFNWNSSTVRNENVLLSFYMYGVVVRSVLSGLGCKWQQRTPIYILISRWLKLLIHRMCAKGQTKLNAYADEFLLIWYPRHWRGAGLVSILFIKQYLYSPKFLQVL
jgi:hypothetical protein